MPFHGCGIAKTFFFAGGPKGSFSGFNSRAKIEYCIQQIWRLLLVAWIEADNSSIMPQHCVTSVIHFVIHSASSTVKRIHLQWRKKYYSTATEFFETKLGILSLSVLIESLNVKVSLLHSQIPPWWGPKQHLIKSGKAVDIKTPPRWGLLTWAWASSKVVHSETLSHRIFLAKAEQASLLSSAQLYFLLLFLLKSCFPLWSKVQILITFYWQIVRN